MNNTQRQPYRSLTKVELPMPHGGTASLCHFCKYAEWSGSPCAGEADLSCSHPLEHQSLWDAMDVWQGNDCWGFRPRYTIDEAADIIGIYLNGEWPEP